MEVINEEERQFLKTLSRGKRLFERTVNQLPGEVIPGDVEGVEEYGAKCCSLEKGIS